MDRSEQLYEQVATGWRRGLYEDVKRTFRAPVVNWIFRTTVANYPELARYVWGQVKPVFQTRRFGRVSVAYRGRVLAELDAEASLPRYRRADLDVPPAEFAELRGQLATYDVVASRLAVLFEVVDRSLTGGDVGASPAGTEASTAPLPPWLDRDRGRPPTMVDADDAPQELEDVVAAIQAFHDLDDGLPSIYRTLAQWPGYLHPTWDDVEPVFQSEVFSSATRGARDVVEAYVDSMAYAPQLSPATVGTVLPNGVRTESTTYASCVLVSNPQNTPVVRLATNTQWVRPSLQGGLDRNCFATRYHKPQLCSTTRIWRRFERLETSGRRRPWSRSWSVVSGRTSS